METLKRWTSSSIAFNDFSRIWTKIERTMGYCKSFCFNKMTQNPVTLIQFNSNYLHVLNLFFFFFERINLDYMFRQRIPLFPWWLQATHCARISQKVLIYFHSVPDVILTHNGQVLVELFSSYAPMCFISRNSHTQKKLLKSKPGRFVFQA